jgi:hypothetical protein
MEPHREEQQKALETSATRKPRRFRIVKLEDRIAPSKGGGGTHNTCGLACTGISCYCGTTLCQTANYCSHCCGGNTVY